MNLSVCLLYLVQSTAQSFISTTCLDNSLDTLIMVSSSITIKKVWAAHNKQKKCNRSFMKRKGPDVYF